MPARWFLDAARSGAAIEPADWQRLVSEAHAANPGLTGPGFGAALSSAGQSSYEILAQAAADLMRGSQRRNVRVLEIASGDAQVLTKLINAWTADGRRAPYAVATDLCLPELRRAWVRNRVLADSAQLPFATASFDCVVSHLGLMLFPDLRGCVEEVARVLRPGGVFAAVVQPPVPPADDAAGSARRAAGSELAAAWREVVGIPVPVPTVGQELASPDLGRIFRRDLGFLEPPLRTVIRLRLTRAPAVLWQAFFSTIYPVWALDSGQQRIVRERVLQALRPHESPNGEVPFEIAAELLTARISQEPGPGATPGS